MHKPIAPMQMHLGEDRLKTFINFVLHYVADLDIPIKRGTFVEFRNGMLNVGAVGVYHLLVLELVLDILDDGNYVKTFIPTVLRSIVSLY